MPNNNRGFTLLELLVTLLIISILFMLCQTNFSPLLSRMVSQDDAYRFFQTLTYARQVAIKHNQLIQVCPTLNQHDCTADWSKGYMVFYHPSASAQDITILRYENTHSRSDIQTYQPVIVQFTGDGRCLNRTTFHIHGEKSSKIVLYDSGRIRLICGA
ncbi:GspH/FimT family pseudopilin [Candidatus Berkiella aquae]|uniref:Type II secretion system protein H n=1 Tax=Candidatus Berkiella aquae TaxID=295108 RepID=A0A0Q9YZ61_9GAMM|nr:GspH/FimT family protein [Candidatus Berkiella aquae]MCS5712491.1 GspH/FimT family protein [Candidatus Berkiella aquae]